MKTLHKVMLGRGKSWQRPWGRGGCGVDCESGTTGMGMEGGIGTLPGMRGSHPVAYVTRFHCPFWTLGP